MLLGVTPADSERNLKEQIDNLVISFANLTVRVFSFTGVRQYGQHTNLSNVELGDVISALSKLQQWTAD